MHHFIISQVNPYLSFVLNDPTKPVSILQEIQGFLASRLRHRINLYVALKLLPSEIHNMADQQWSGTPQDITCFPDHDVSLLPIHTSASSDVDLFGY